MASANESEGVGAPDDAAVRAQRDRLIDALGLLAAAGFLGWLALAWGQDAFTSWVDAWPFLLFFLALTGACLYRCLRSVLSLFRHDFD
ncbi:MAG: hypothetical protein PVI15_06180 [Chromatiales bacterium]|jgi:hypothetical protein